MSTARFIRVVLWAGAGSAPRTVAVTIETPVDGATVNTHALKLIGSVSPRDAKVTAAGTNVKVENGSFRQPLTLAGRVLRIAVAASAPGYRPSARHPGLDDRKKVADALPGGDRGNTRMTYENFEPFEPQAAGVTDFARWSSGPAGRS